MSQIAVRLLLFVVVTSAPAGQTPPRSATTPRRGGNPEAARIVNPVERTQASIADGRRTYQRLCQRCHGVAGKGDGGGAGAGGQPADLTDADWEFGASDGEVFSAIREGTSADMESYAERISETEMWNLVNFIRSLGPELPAAAQAHGIHRIPAVSDELVNRPLTVRSGIGTAHDPVSTASKEAQSFYDLGLAYLHSFAWVDAARSFNQALRFDSTLAMAHVGLSLALTELNSSARAAAALGRARALAGNASAHDRAHIEARSLQAAAEAVPRDPSRLVAYRTALDRALEVFPADAELWLLRGIATSDDPADRGQGASTSAISYFDRALAVRPGHFAAEHYLTHAHENAGRAEDAMPHAAAYAEAAASMPHAQHMYGHVLRRVGRIGEAVARFELAHTLEAAHVKAENIPPEHQWHYEHNLELLASSYRYLGQMSAAASLLNTAFNTPSSLAVQMANKREWPAFLTSRGRIAEALTAASVLIGHPAGFVRAAGHIEAGHAQLAVGKFPAAAEAVNRALRELKASPGVAPLVGAAFEGLQGEFFLRTGQREKGRALLEAVARRVRQQPGPDAWVQALFVLEGMARAAREAGDWSFAGWAAREMLAHDPNYAGSHFALGLVAEHNGQASEARAAFAAAERLWSNADPSLPELLAVRQPNSRR